MDLFLEWIKVLLPIIIAVCAFVIVLAITIKYKIPSLEKRVEKLETISHTQEVTKLDMTATLKKSELYGPDGIPIYQGRGGCEQMQDTCRRTICMKMDEVNHLLNSKMEHMESKLKKMDDARESTRREISNVMKDFHDQQMEIVKIATNVKQLLSEHSVAQTAAIVKQVVKELKSNGAI